MKKFIAVSLSSFALLALFGCQQKPAATTQPVVSETTNATVDIQPAPDRTATSTATLQIGPVEGDTMESKSAADDRSAAVEANVTIGSTEEAKKPGAAMGDVMAEPSL